MTKNSRNEEGSVTHVLKALEAIRAGEMIILTDDEDRENEGDLVLAASDVCPEKINFMAKEARGLICLSLTAQRIEQLGLPMMKSSRNSPTPLETAFTVSIEAKTGVTTGISAADRARTIQVATDPNSGPEDLVVPGHIFPLRSRAGGVLERAGHTEGSTDLVRLAGKEPAAVICEIMSEDGSMARSAELAAFAETFKLPMVSISDLITYRLLRETLVEEVARQPFETPKGIFTGIWFQNMVDCSVHFALVNREMFHPGQCVEVRVQKQDIISDAFAAPGIPGSSRHALDYGLQLLAGEKPAAMIYLCHKDPARSVLNSLKKQLVPMDPKLVGIGAQMIRHLGITTMNLHVRSQKHLKGLTGFGIEIQSVEFLT